MNVQHFFPLFPRDLFAAKVYFPISSHFFPCYLCWLNRSLFSLATSCCGSSFNFWRNAFIFEGSIHSTDLLKWWSGPRGVVYKHIITVYRKQKLAAFSIVIKTTCQNMFYFYFIFVITCSCRKCLFTLVQLTDFA